VHLGEGWPAPRDRVVYRERLTPTPLVGVERGQAEPEPALVWKARDRRMKRLLGAPHLTRLGQGDGERIVGLGVPGIDRERLAQYFGRLRIALKAQEPRAQHAPGPGAFGLQRDGMTVAKLGAIIVAAELVRVSQVDLDARLLGRKQRGLLERTHRSGRVALPYVGAPEVHPVRRLPGPVAHGGLERERCHSERAFVEGVSPAHGLGMDASREHQQEQAGERLTRSAKPQTIASMTRDVLQAILRAEGISSDKGGTYHAQAEQRITFYLGSEGRGMTVNDVEEVRLTDLFLTLVTRETGNVHTDYAAVFALAVKPLKSNAPPRAGFA
jgi:hypothetical protein